MRTRKVFLAVAAMVTMLIVPSPVVADTPGGADMSETTADGRPVPASPQQYYEIRASDFGGAEFGEIGVQKAALPLPAVPLTPEPAFIAQCEDPRNEDKAATDRGWTLNHYRWCRSLWWNWDHPEGDPTHRLRVRITWVGYADPLTRRYVIWGIVRKNFEMTPGAFPDDALIGAWADMGCEPVATCGQNRQPSIGATLAELRQQDRTFRTELTSSSAGRTAPDFITRMNVFTVISAKGGSAGSARDRYKTGGLVESRCDSTRPRLRSAEGCIFNNVWPVLTYNKADTLYPVNDLIDHIRYAQDVKGAPGKFVSGQQPGVPLHRQRDRARNRQHRDRARASCRLTTPTWNWRVEQCDEYPFASTAEGTASGGPASARLIKASHNREGGIQLNNWYTWDRILATDQFWVQVIG